MKALVEKTMGRLDESASSLESVKLLYLQRAILPSGQFHGKTLEDIANCLRLDEKFIPPVLVGWYTSQIFSIYMGLKVWQLLRKMRS